eukprot:2346202-Rhodomonas_salina.1
MRLHTTAHAQRCASTQHIQHRVAHTELEPEVCYLSAGLCIALPGSVATLRSCLAPVQPPPRSLSQ